MHCPRCRAPTVMLLEAVSRMSPLNHYTCARCGYAWTKAKRIEPLAEEDDDSDEDA